MTSGSCTSSDLGQTVRMFTGIVEAVGTVKSVRSDTAGLALEVSAADVVAGASVGDSVAVNGCCLTMTSVTAEGFTADVMAETLRATTMGRLRPGDLVNLERPLRADGRFDGHIVQGHVDAAGTIRSVGAAPNATVVWIDTPPDVLRYCVPKGSVTVDGIALTIVDVDAGGFSVAIIPHTWAATNLRVRVPGDTVNLEADVVAKYVERLIRTEPQNAAGTMGDSQGSEPGTIR
jgi:riboflavin synthase